MFEVALLLLLIDEMAAAAGGISSSFSLGNWGLGGGSGRDSATITKLSLDFRCSAKIFFP